MHSPPVCMSSQTRGVRHLRDDALESEAEVVFVDDVRGDGLGDNLVEDRLPTTVAPAGGSYGLRLFLLPSSRAGRHVAKNGGYARAGTDADAAAGTRHQKHGGWDVIRLFAGSTFSGRDTSSFHGPNVHRLS